MEERSAPGLVDSRYKMAAGKIPARGSHLRHLQLISDPTGFRPRGSTYHHAVCGAELNQIQIEHSSSFPRAIFSTSYLSWWCTLPATYFQHTHLVDGSSSFFRI